MIEEVKSNDEIQHPAVRGVLKYLKIEDGLEIHHDGDLPARTGLGSSSAFTVGLIHAVYALKETMLTKMQLAREAIKVEQDVLKENVGSQDQVLAAHGGFCRIEFFQNEEIRITPIIARRQRVDELKEHLLLYFTGFSRTASEIAGEQIKNTKDLKSELSAMYQMVNEGVEILSGNHSFVEFGKLLHESWKLKRSLSSKISSPAIDSIYEIARRAGAVGGKLLGAGGGGFILFMVKPEDHSRVRLALDRLLEVPFQFETGGSQIMLYEPTKFRG